MKVNMRAGCSSGARERQILFRPKRWYCFFAGGTIPSSRMATITCKIPKALNAELEAVASKRGVAKSVVLREALVANLKQQHQAANLSAFDVMREACGVVKGGPSDRSWNKKHLKGYGRD